MYKSNKNISLHFGSNHALNFHLPSLPSLVKTHHGKSMTSSCR